MKNKFKFISFSLLLILILAISFGCTSDDRDKNGESNGITIDEKISMELGFLSDKHTKDNKQFIEIGENGTSLEFEVLDGDTFENLELYEYYMISYNEKNIVKSIETNEYMKKLVLASMEEDINLEDPLIISKSEKFDVSNLTLLDAYIIDIDGDGEDERVAMYTRAEKDAYGEMMWDDGQDWLVIVEGKDNDYVLFNDYVQIGSMQFFVYTIEDNFYVSTITSSTANLKMKEYKFNKENESFEENLKFTTKGNVIMLHSTK